jgi:hypothetical protein
MSAFTRVFDAQWRRTRNPEKQEIRCSGFRVRTFGAPRNDGPEFFSRLLEINARGED